MSKLWIFAVIAVLATASHGLAGTLTIDPGQPTYNPSSSFVNPQLNIAVAGSIAHGSGNMTIKGTPGSTATVNISGSYSATAGESIFTSYHFTADNNTGGTINYEVKGTASGIPFLLRVSSRRAGIFGLGPRHIRLALVSADPFPAQLLSHSMHRAVWRRKVPPSLHPRPQPAPWM